MKKTMCILAALLQMPVVPVFASTTRMLSLGMDNWQLEDETNFWSNPALLKAAPDLVTIEIGTQTAAGSGITAGSQWGGFHKSIGSTVWGLYIRRPYGLNDFANTASPLLTPVIGGQISANNVFDNSFCGAGTGLDTCDTQFDVGGDAAGPFGAGGSALGITGAPGSFTRNLAVPANYLDLLFALPLGQLWDFGMRFNYARNAPGETRHASHNSGNGVAITSGTITLDRDSDEFNFQMGFNRKPEESGGVFGFQLVGSLSRPSYSMYYEELRRTLAYSRSKIDLDGNINSNFLMRLSWKFDNGSTHAITTRAGIQEISGTASRQDDSTPGGALEVDRRATFENDRRYGAMDYTWHHAFSQALLAASVGFQVSKTKQTWFFSSFDTSGLAHEEDSIHDERWVVPVRVAAEIRPWNKLAIRAGIQKNFFTSVDRTVSDVDGSGQAQVTRTDTVEQEAPGTANGVGLSFGLGFALTERLMIDTVVRQTLLFHGPYFIGGVANRGIFAHASLVYKFGEPRDTLLEPVFRPRKNKEKDWY